MLKKLSTLFFAVIAMTLVTVGTALAQYDIYNDSSVPIDVSLHIYCPGPPASLSWTPTYTIPAGGSLNIPVAPPCTVPIVIVNGVGYLMGYAGAITPPNPPNTIEVKLTFARIR